MILVIPMFPLIIVIAAYEKNAGTMVLVVVLAVTGWSYGARQLRSQTLSLRSRDFLDGGPGARRAEVVHHRVRDPADDDVADLVACFLGAALYAVLFAAGLQFIGLGDPNSVSWGTMLYWAENNEALQTGQYLWAIVARRVHRAARGGLRAAQLRLRRDQQPGAAAGAEDRAERAG